jgi:hypothetical protein
MEVMQEQVIEVALNTAGYLVAGAFWLLLYTTWQNRRAHATQPVSEQNSQTEPSPVPSTPASARAGQFVDLSASTASASPNTATPGRDTDKGRRRNRAEVFALARTMLEKGETYQNIKQSMPISDGELALLTGNK